MRGGYLIPQFILLLICKEIRKRNPGKARTKSLRDEILAILRISQDEIRESMTRGRG